jgi:ERCC4-type nuclease
VELTRLEYGDVAFSGAGPDGSPVSTSCEIKGLSDLTACMTDARFSGHQLPGLLQNYDQVWLLVVGVFKARERDGVLVYQMQRGKSAGYWQDASHGRRRAFLWRDLMMFLTTMQIKAGIRVAVVDDYEMAANWVHTLWSWWQRGWDDHDSHLQIHDAMRDQLFDRALLTRPSLTRCICAQLPNIGKEKSAAVAAKFKSVRAMVEASEEDWMSIPGVGRTIAHKVYVALRGGSNGTGNGH